MTAGSEIVGVISFVRGEVYAKHDEDCSVSVASIPMGQGGRVPPPNIYFGGDMPINVPPNIWEFLFLKH